MAFHTFPEVTSVRSEPVVHNFQKKSGQQDLSKVLTNKPSSKSSWGPKACFLVDWMSLEDRYCVNLVVNLNWIKDIHTLEKYKHTVCCNIQHIAMCVRPFKMNVLVSFGVSCEHHFPLIIPIIMWLVPRYKSRTYW